MKEYYHSVNTIEEKCEGCMSCMRSCPTNAIRIREGESVRIGERCVDCGECLKACDNDAIEALTDPFGELPEFDKKIAVPSPVLFSQFTNKINPAAIIEALKSIGFDDVIITNAVCEEVSKAVKRFIEESSKKIPFISSVCPAVIRLIQVNYPELTGSIIPINVPRELVASKIRERYKTRETRLFYITPCPAKIISIKQPAEKEESYFDGAVAIKDIYPALVSSLSKGRSFNKSLKGSTSDVGFRWAREGGVSIEINQDRKLSVSGIQNVTKVFDDIENGLLRDIDFVECHTCLNGCVGGPLTVQNTYLSRANLIRLERQYRDRNVVNAEVFHSRYENGFYSLKQEVLPRPLERFEDDIKTAISKERKKQKINEKLPGIDCGACGSPDCKTFAEDVLKGHTELKNCPVENSSKTDRSGKELSLIEEETK